MSISTGEFLDRILGGKIVGCLWKKLNPTEQADVVVLDVPPSFRQTLAESLGRVNVRRRLAPGG